MSKNPRIAIDCPKCGGRCRINGGSRPGSGIRYCCCTVCNFRFRHANGETRELNYRPHTLSERGALVVKPESKKLPVWMVLELLTSVTTRAARSRLMGML